MATLADLEPGDQFLFACQVTSVDPVAGTAIALFGPARAQAGTAAISPAGAMTGQLAAPADQVPVTLVTGFAPVSVGDIMQNDATGETMACRWSQIGPDGTVTWASSPGHRVVYPAAGWTVVGHVSGL